MLKYLTKFVWVRTVLICTILVRYKRYNSSQKYMTKYLLVVFDLCFYLENNWNLETFNWNSLFLVEVYLRALWIPHFLYVVRAMFMRRLCCYKILRKNSSPFESELGWVCRSRKMPLASYMLTAANGWKWCVPVFGDLARQLPREGLNTDTME